jgi:hypothetical protein
MTDNIETVDRSEVPARDWDGPGRPPSALSARLVAGETVFIPGGDHRTAARSRGRKGHVARQGMRIRSRVGEREGVPGVYLWAEEIDRA